MEEQQKNKERTKAFNVPVSDAADFQQRMKGGPGTQFAGCTGTKVQKIKKLTLRARASESSSEKMHMSDSAAINAAFSGLFFS